MIESYEKATASAKAESDRILYQVARMKAEFELLKDVIMDNLELDYSGEKLKLKDDKLVIALMETIEPDDMAGILNVLRAEKEEKIRKAMELNGKEAENG